MLGGNEKAGTRRRKGRGGIIGQLLGCGSVQSYQNLNESLDYLGRLCRNHVDIVT